MAYLAEVGGVPQGDLERTFNCGIGMAAIVAPEAADLTIRSLAARGMKAWAAGVIEVDPEANSGATAQLASQGRSALEGSLAAR